MAVKTTGVVLKHFNGLFYVDFREDHIAEEVKTFLQANMGQEVEIVLTTKEELRLAYEARTAVEGKGLDRGELSSCASSRYWQSKKDPED